MTRPILVLCDACGSEGRLLTANGNDPYSTDHGECPYCEGTGLALVDSEPVSLDDLCALTEGHSHE